MIWLGVALLSGLVAGVGFWRGTPSGLASQAMPGAAGVLFSLLMFRASSLIPDRKELGKLGGWPLLVSGALSLTAALAGAVDVVIWLQSRFGTVGPYVLPVAALGFVLMAVTSLRLSLNSQRRTQFYALGLAALANAVVSAFFFVQALQSL